MSSAVQLRRYIPSQIDPTAPTNWGTIFVYAVMTCVIIGLIVLAASYKYPSIIPQLTSPTLSIDPIVNGNPNLVIDWVMQAATSVASKNDKKTFFIDSHYEDNRNKMRSPFSGKIVAISLTQGMENSKITQEGLLIYKNGELLVDWGFTGIINDYGINYFVNPIPCDGGDVFEVKAPFGGVRNKVVNLYGSAQDSLRSSRISIKPPPVRKIGAPPANPVPK